MKDVQLSLFEQASRLRPGVADDEVLRDICERLLDEAECEPPVDVRLLASMRGISDIRESEQPWAGMLLPAEGRLLVHVKSGDGAERQRFTVLHEAGHTMLPGFRESPQYRCGGPTTREEQLCDMVASELLFPRRHFQSDLRTVGFTTAGLEALADRYQASLEATAIRAVDLSEEPSLLLVFKLQHKPSERGHEAEFEPKLRLDWSRSHGAWPYLRRAKSVEASSAFGRAYEGEVVDELTELGPILAGSPREAVRVSARRFGNEVLALVQPK